MKKSKIIAALLICIFTLGISEFTAEAKKKEEKAKYIFLFIGDGMGCTHVSAAESYLSYKEGNLGGAMLTMTQFPYFGTATTYSANRYVTDSSAAGTAIASGEKTNNGMLGVDPDGNPVKSFAYDLKEDGYQIGIISTVGNFVADMLLVDDLHEVIPSAVFYGGKLVAENGKMVAYVEEKTHELENKNTMFVKKLSEDDFVIQSEIENGKVMINVVEYESMNSSNTVLIQKQFDVVDHVVQLDDERYKFASVINRHEGFDTMTLAIVKDFGTTCGALASTIAHDSHNLVIVYDTPRNALMAANALISCGGGMCAVKENKILHTLELPLAGLMSLKEAKDLIVDSKKMKKAINELGLVDIHNPLLRIVTLCLPVVPYVKISDLGLIDVINKKIIPLFV